mmetsp:Transcript_80792/g.261966  ORF Transcript_80792/g.261966 Transcript_80792/m.261966 type:complete len:258 (-) Transcript_80792:2795-3568(-)
MRSPQLLLPTETDHGDIAERGQGALGAAAGGRGAPYGEADGPVRLEDARLEREGAGDIDTATGIHKGTGAGVAVGVEAEPVVAPMLQLRGVEHHAPDRLRACQVQRVEAREAPARREGRLHVRPRRVLARASEVRGVVDVGGLGAILAKESDRGRALAGHFGAARQVHHLLGRGHDDGGAVAREGRRHHREAGVAEQDRSAPVHIDAHLVPLSDSKACGVDHGLEERRVLGDLSPQVVGLRTQSHVACVLRKWWTHT